MGLKISKLREYPDPKRDVLVPVLYFHHFSTHDESFLKEYICCGFSNLIGKDDVSGSARAEEACEQESSLRLKLWWECLNVTKLHPHIV